jgi:proliferating cell nuclear antigen
MFSAKVKADVLKSIIEAASPLVSEVKLNIKTDGISFRAVDSAHVAMIDLNVSSKAFEEYKADEMELGVDLDKLNGILRLASSNDIVSLEYDEEAHRLVIRIGNLVRRMGLIDTAGMPDPKVPNLNLPSKVIIKSNELSQGIKASQAISDHVALSVDPDGFELYAEGDTDTVNLRLPKDLLSELQAPQKCRSLFSIDYFSNMIKPVKGEEDVTIFLGNDNPVKLEFDFADKNGHVTYLLAPRIESE